MRETTARTRRARRQGRFFDVAHALSKGFVAAERNDGLQLVAQIGDQDVANHDRSELAQIGFFWQRHDQVAHELAIRSQAEQVGIFLELVVDQMLEDMLQRLD